MASVVVSDADPGWPAAFAREASRLQPVLVPWLTDGILHIGSTAVPGLPAKPTLDMLAVVADMGAAADAVAPLADAGYHHAPHRVDALWFFREQGDVRTHQLHLAAADAPLVRERLTFRDALREDDELMAAYARLKQQNAQEFPESVSDYTRAKRGFVAAVLADRGVHL